MKSFEFVTISMSHYLKTQDDIGDIFPSEISIVKTSLGGGLNNDTYYHTIVMRECKIRILLGATLHVWGSVLSLLFYCL